MQVWELVIGFKLSKQALAVLLSKGGETNEAILELDITTLNTYDGKESYMKNSTLFSWKK